MTDDARLPDPLAAARALPEGSMVVVRSRRDPAPLTRALLKLRHVTVIVAGDPLLAVRLGAHGVHLPEARAREAGHWRARFPRLLITTAAHSLRALMLSRGDAMFLSPVYPTESHPSRAALSPLRANLIARQSSRRVIALGGIDAANAARLSGFAGIAAIKALTP
ncbi:MAG: thiamine phosphate synthase [Alphaproteobacteria bacterium]|nr:thiamine phosphate synthase [Alphaproteobacteria bacterium]